MNDLDFACFISNWKFTLAFFVLVILTGCTNSPAERQAAVEQAFTNQHSEVKATTELFQYIVRCEDGSIWEVKTKDTGMTPLIDYRNCLFDPLYRLPVRPVAPPAPPIPLEKVETNLAPSSLFDNN